MVKSRRILSVVLSIVMVLTMLPMAAFNTVSAQESITTAASVDTHDGKLVMPSVTLAATPVFRLASANDGSTLAIGNKLVSATPSGLPRITGSYAAQYYAGETPVAPTVIFTTDKTLSSTPSIQASVAGLTFSTPTVSTSSSGTTYTWTVSGGNNTFNRGNINFTVGYTYSYTDSLTGKTVTKNYNAYTSAYAEYIAQPAGAFIYRERSAPWTTHEREHSAFDTRIIGANTYSTFADNSAKDYTRGYYNFFNAGDSFTTVDGVADNYGQIYISRVKQGDTGTEYHLTAVDKNRPVAITYVDLNGGKPTLAAANNLRLSFFEALNRSGYDRYVNWTEVLEGEVVHDSDSANSNTAMNQIGLPLVDGESIPGYGEKHYSFTGNGYVDAAKEEASTGNKFISYTVVGCSGTNYTSKSDRICRNAVGISLRIYTYDKSELRFYISDLLRENDPLTKTVQGSEIGLNPQSQFYSSGWSAYETALRNAQGILAKPDTNQKAIDAALASLQTAVSGLKVKGADFTQSNIALDRFKALDSNLYTAASWQRVVNARDALVAAENYSTFYQCAVDKLVADLNDAINNLEEALADWELVESAIEAYESLFYKDYTTASWNVLRDAVTIALEKKENKNDYKISQQEYVNSLAYAISDAINALEYSLANYDAFNAQLERYDDIIAEMNAKKAELEANGVDFGALGITNLYTDSSVRRVENNSTIDRTIQWPQQSIVDDATASLKAAIDALKYRDGITTGLEAALEDADNIIESWWTPESYAALMEISEEAYDTIIMANPKVSITEQDTINRYEQDIRQAIEDLEPAAADYDRVIELSEYAETLDPDLYVEETYDALMDEVALINWDYEAKDQDKVDLIAVRLQNAINNLRKLSADYSRVDAAIRNWDVNYKANASDYTNSADVVAAINRVVRGLEKDKQNEVNKMAIDIENAIAALRLKPADYTNLKAEYTKAKNAVNKQNNYAAANNGYAYYKTETYNALVTFMSTISVDANGNIIEDKTIKQQSEVNAMYTALKAAVDALELNSADYTKLIAALARVPSDEDLEYLYTPETGAILVVAAMEGQAAVDDMSYSVEQQADVDNLTRAVEDAIRGLEYNDANYSDLEIELANIPTDLSIYTTESVVALNKARASVPVDAGGRIIKDKKITEQDVVDGWTEAIAMAVLGLEEWFADYTTVEAAITAADGKVAAGKIGETNIYTDESIAAVDAAKAAVVYGKYHKDQADVDAMAKAIRDAADALAEKPLDLTNYNKATEDEAAKGNLDQYTEASVAAMNSAKGTVTFFLNTAGNNKISKQTEFDALVAAYSDAIEALEYKGADYTVVNVAVKAADDEIAKGIYTDESVQALRDEIDAIVIPGKLITEQEDVNAMADAIYEAIRTILVEKPLDLTKYNQATAKEAAKGGLAQYTDESVNAMNAAKAAADAFKAENNKISKQPEFEALVAAYDRAIDRLDLKLADYTELMALVQQANALVPEYYENYDEIYWGGMYELLEETIPANMDLPLARQPEVDAMKAELQGYLDALIALGADYDAVNNKVTEAENKINTGWYTDETVAALQDVIDGINRDYKIWDQAKVDAYVPQLTAAIGALELKPANYTEVKALETYVNALAEAGGYDADKDVTYDNFDEIYWTYMYTFINETLPEQMGYKIDEQAKVDALRDELQSYIDMLRSDAIAAKFELKGSATVKNGEYIIGLEFGLSRTDFENRYTVVEYAKITYSNFKSKRTIGTGTVITVTSTIDSSVIAVYTIVIFGDLDGDGFCTNVDLGLIKAAVNGTGSRLTGAQEIAADITGKRAGIDANDLAMFYKVIDTSVVINQKTGKAS